MRVNFWAPLKRSSTTRKLVRRGVRGMGCGAAGVRGGVATTERRVGFWAGRKAGHGAGGAQQAVVVGDRLHREPIGPDALAGAHL